jgi:hypothetical protein
MSPNEKHPHLEDPSDEDLEALLEGKKPAVRSAYLATHRLVRETLPDVNVSVDTVDGVTGYAVRQYGYDGWGMAALAAHGSWASLILFRGADLDDPTGLLEGVGKKVRHVKIRTPEQFEERRDAMRALVEEAARIHGA